MVRGLQAQLALLIALERGHQFFQLDSCPGNVLYHTQQQQLPLKEAEGASLEKSNYILNI